MTLDLNELDKLVGEATEPFAEPVYRHEDGNICVMLKGRAVVDLFCPNPFGELTPDAATLIARLAVRLINSAPALIERVRSAEDRSLDNNVLAHGWQRRADALLAVIQRHPEALKDLVENGCDAPLPSPADVPALQARVAVLEGHLRAILNIDREAPEFGLCDCIDNEGEHYKSADLESALIDARQALEATHDPR